MTVKSSNNAYQISRKDAFKILDNNRMYAKKKKIKELKHSKFPMLSRRKIIILF